MAVEKQIEMDLGDVPDNTIGVDPVSGNEIPLGSTAENVRDDIPANLSEGEIVIAADVVNFHGVKLFEDLRKEAKMGYAQMAEDGRIGGEPMEEDSIDIELTIEDLEVMDTPEVEEAFMGKLFTGKKDDDDDEPRDRSYSAIVKRAKASKDKPKNRAEAFLKALREKSDKPKLKKKPSKSDDDTGPSIAEQINFGGDKPFIERFLEGLGFDEGGLTAQVIVYGPDGTAYPTPQAAIDAGVTEYSMTPPSQQKQPFYSQKGGFDLGAVETPTVQVVEYVNDDGHRIFITFLNGEPTTEIPEGYYPAGDPIDVGVVGGDEGVVEGEVPTDPVDGSTSSPAASGSDMGDDDGMDIPESINYKELTLDELKDMVDDMSSFGTKLMNTSLITRTLLKIQNKQTIKEIERRITDPNVSEVDKMRYKNLLELANREQPNLIQTIGDKLTKNTLGRKAEQIPKPVIPDVDYSDPTLAPTPYTPDTQKESNKTTPGVPKTAAQIIQDEIDIKRIEDNMAPRPPRPTAPAPSYTKPMNDPYAEDRSNQSSSKTTVDKPEVRGNTKLEKDAQRRRDRQEANKNITGSTARKTDVARSATRGLGTTDKKGGAALDSRFGISGLDKGGIASKKKKKKKSK